MPFIMQPQSLNKHVMLIDVQGWDFSHTTSVLIIHGQDRAIIETGHHRCGKQIATALKVHGIPFETIRYVFLTHRHGDHCGGTTPLAESLPNMTVGAHRYTIATLHDPDKINAGARQLFGPFAQDIQPLPIDVSTRELQDGDLIDLGQGIEITVIETPGHTSDHLAFFEAHTRTLYSGDALGLLGPIHHTVTPTSFPPSFKYQSYQNSIEKLRTFDPVFLVFSHFGAVTGSDISTIFDRALVTLDTWKETVEQFWHSTGSHSEVMVAIKNRFSNDLEVFPHAARPLLIQAMATGLMRSLLAESSEE